MNLYVLIPFTAFLVNFFTWTYIFAQKRGGIVTRAYLYFAGYLTIWTAGKTLTWIKIISPGTVLYIYKFNHSIAMLVGIFYTVFLFSIIKKKIDKYLYFYLLLLIPAIIIIFTTNTSIKGINEQVWGYNFITGSLYLPYFIIFVLLPIIYTTYFAIKKYIKTQNKEIKYAIKSFVILALIILGIAVITDVIFTSIINKNVMQISAVLTSLHSVVYFFIIKKLNYLDIDITDISDLLFRKNPGGIIILNNEKKIMNINNSAVEIFSLENAEVVSEHINQIFDYPNYSIAGGKLIYSFRGKTLLITESNAVINKIKMGSVLFVNDITELKDIQIKQKDLINELDEKNRELKKAFIKAQEANKIKTNFLGVISHDIRTPLSAITGFTEIILSRHKLNRETEELMHYIYESAETLRRIIENVLQLTVLETGKFKITYSKFDFDSVVENIKLIFDFKLKLKKIDLVYDNRGNTELVSDVTLIKHLLINMVGNALKHTSTGKIEIQLERKSRNFSIKIIDTGEGIDKKTLEKMKLLFSDDTQTEKIDEFGLGLMICKKITKELNGNIHVNTVPGKGSVFTFELPYAEVE